MIGAVQVAGAGAPDHLPEDQNKDKEEDTDHFKEEYFSYPAEGFEESTHATRQASGRTACGLSCCALGSGSTHSIDGHRPRSRCSRRIAGRSLSTACKVLSGHAARHANADSQHPTDGLRFHTRL